MVNVMSQDSKLVRKCIEPETADGINGFSSMSRVFENLVEFVIILALFFAILAAVTTFVAVLFPLMVGAGTILLCVYVIVLIIAFMRT